MKTIGLVIISSLVLILVLSGCSNAESKPQHIQEHINKAKNGVDIWTSVQFEVVNDTDIIKENDSENLEKADKPVMLDVLIRIKNNGNKNAHNIDITAKEPLPYNFLSSHSSGPTGPILNSGEETEMHQTWIFSERTELNSFISELVFVVTWDEDGKTKESYVKISN